MDAVEPMGVIDRLKEQLLVGRYVRGAKKAIYKADGKGRKILSSYAVQHIQVLSADIVELCDLCRNQDDEIVQAQRKGHKAAMGFGGEGKATMYADHLFHLIALAEPVFKDESQEELQTV